MSSKVFISYCHRDLKYADAVAVALQDAGISVFLDTKIHIGEFWDCRLELEISSAAAVVVIWTLESVKSQWVRKEASFALRLGKLCPVIMEPCEIPLQFSDVQAAPLVDWSKNNPTHPSWMQLLNKVRQLASGAHNPGVTAQGEIAFRLAKKFLEGQGCPRDLPLARQLLLEANRLGHKSAAEVLKTIASK